MISWYLVVWFVVCGSCLYLGVSQRINNARSATRYVEGVERDWAMENRERRRANFNANQKRTRDSAAAAGDTKSRPTKRVRPIIGTANASSAGAAAAAAASAVPIPAPAPILTTAFDETDPHDFDDPDFLSYDALQSRFGQDSADAEEYTLREAVRSASNELCTLIVTDGRVDRPGTEVDYHSDTLSTASAPALSELLSHGWSSVTGQVISHQTRLNRRRFGRPRPTALLDLCDGFYDRLDFSAWQFLEFTGQSSSAFGVWSGADQNRVVHCWCGCDRSLRHTHPLSVEHTMQDMCWECVWRSRRNHRNQHGDRWHDEQCGSIVSIDGARLGSTYWSVYELMAYAQFISLNGITPQPKCLRRRYAKAKQSAESALARRQLIHNLLSPQPATNPEPVKPLKPRRPPARDPNTRDPICSDCSVCDSQTESAECGGFHPRLFFSPQNQLSTPVYAPHELLSAQLTHCLSFIPRELIAMVFAYAQRRFEVRLAFAEFRIAD